MNSHSLESIAMRWFEAFNKRELDTLLALYHPEAEHYSPKLKARHPETAGLVKGVEALGNWWQDAFDRLPSLHYHVTTLTANSERIFMEYIRQVDDEADLRVAEVLDIREGLIISSRVYHG